MQQCLSILKSLPVATLAEGDSCSRRSTPFHESYLCAVCAPKVSTI